MNKMLVAVFDTEPAAYEGLSALKDLHEDGDITLYATAVIAEDSSGVVTMKQGTDEGPIGMAIGVLTGSALGLLGGPVGIAIGASLGSLTGMIFDLNKSGIDLAFVDEVSKALTPGKAAVLADIEETWLTPVDTKLGKLGGIVFRRLRSEVVEDQLVREAAADSAELKQLKEEFAQSKPENKAEVQKHIDAAKEKIQASDTHAKAILDQAKVETEAKLAALEAQMKGANDRQKAKIKKRIVDAKASYEARRVKLEQARKLAKQALSSQ
jgi:uncharacterized membrane protein